MIDLLSRADLADYCAVAFVAVAFVAMYQIGRGR